MSFATLSLSGKIPFANKRLIMIDTAKGQKKDQQTFWWPYSDIIIPKSFIFLEIVADVLQLIWISRFKKNFFI